MKLRFLIASPRYDHQIGGVMLLHQLCDMLNRQGFEAAMVLYGGSPPHYNWAYSNLAELYHPRHQRVELSMDNVDQSVRDFLEHGVIIYPERVTGNPLGASRVIKYLLYKDEKYVRETPSEYLLSFSKLFHANPDGYLFKPFSDDNLHANGARHWSERSMDLTYFGKGPQFTECFRIPQTLVLSRKWPEDKNQLGILLRQCRYFFTWDAVTQTNLDAVACGAVPVMLHDLQMGRQEMDGGEMGALPDVRLSNLQDAGSVLGDAAQIDRAMQEINQRGASYIDTWPQRVLQFANDVHRHFQIS